MNAKRFTKKRTIGILKEGKTGAKTKDLCRRHAKNTEALWGSSVSSGAVSRLNQKIYRHIEAGATRKVESEFAYLFLDGAVLKRSWVGDVRNVSVLVAIGVGIDGHWQILGVAEGQKEDLDDWRGFLHDLKDRGLSGVQLIISDACLGLVEAAVELLPDAQWQRCCRPLLSQRVQPKGKVADVARMLKAIHAQEERRSAEDKVRKVIAKLKTMRFRKAAELVETKAHETLTYFAFPSNHWRQLKTNNPLERIIREIRRRTRVVGAFLDGHSALMLVAARLRHTASTKWGKQHYHAVETLLNPLPEETAA